MKGLLAAVAVFALLTACAPPPPPPPPDPLAGIAAALIAAGYTQQPDGTWAPPPPDPLEGIARALRDAGYTQNPDGTWSPPAPTAPPTTTRPPTTTTTRPTTTWRTGDDPNTPPSYKVMRDSSPFKLPGVPYYISMRGSESFGRVSREGPAAIITVTLFASLFPQGQGQVDYTIAHESGHVIDMTQPSLTAPAKALIDQEPNHPPVTEAFADCYAQKRTIRLVSGYWNCPAHILAVTP